MSTTPWLSLVLLSFKRFDTTTGPCLATLAEADADEDVELILVDNGSDDGAAQRCAEAAAARPRIRAASAVTMARAMSRTAWTFKSRIAWYDQTASRISELPADTA